jgi:hypothetical protein
MKKSHIFIDLTWVSIQYWICTVVEKHYKAIKAWYIVAWYQQGMHRALKMAI